MSKVIGIVSEGPTDYLVLKSVIDRISGEENRYLPLQPEKDLMGQYGNGWKGVWKWCKETGPLDMIMDCISPGIDTIVIQMDGDVIRKEKEPHCLCDSVTCEEKGLSFPLYCRRAISGMCPVVVPCGSHSKEISALISHGKHILSETVEVSDESRVIITIPCDSTDAWIIASYEELKDIEAIADPWHSIIAKQKYYKNVRVRSDKKSSKTYRIFAEHIAENWTSVTRKCLSARQLDEAVRKIFESITPP